VDEKELDRWIETHDSLPPGWEDEDEWPEEPPPLPPYGAVLTWVLFVLLMLLLADVTYLLLGQFRDLIHWFAGR
jgi:hypothetical protein